MAKLFPALNPAEIANAGERTVARALVEHLPNRVEVFHGFNWLSRTRAGTIMEARVRLRAAGCRARTAFRRGQGRFAPVRRQAVGPRRPR